MKSQLFSFEDKVNIRCGSVVILTPIWWGIMTVIPMYSTWVLGLGVLLAGLVLIVTCNLSKYRLVKDKEIVSFKRCVVLDSVLVIVAGALIWATEFAPDPFSWEEFLSNERKFIFPFGALIYGVLLSLPMLFTNKKITKALIR